MAATFDDLITMAENLLDYTPRLLVRDRVLNTSELCANILEYLPEYDLVEAVGAGGPLLKAARDFPHLRQYIQLDYRPSRDGRPNLEFVQNHFIFWAPVFCGHRRGDHCPCRMWESEEVPTGGTAEQLAPSMEIDKTETLATRGAEPVTLRFTNLEEDFDEMLASRALYLNMRLGTHACDIRIEVHNPETMTWPRDWQAPPSVIEWHTAEIVVNITELRMYGIIRIAKNLFECGSTIDSKLFKGEVNIVDEETGAVDELDWQKYFHSKDMEAVVGGGPKYRWFWKATTSDTRWMGSTYAEAKYTLANSFPPIYLP
ncbi:hypothetical protein PRZ48_008883 [Zasmidium cellare]|uniref:Uncharacterized protein n=1 Tax=Zasmidium cellare TaxID=395010 RepID=A0ABR0EGS3_ZASCE|nr:hypothetical protein PRZ48_008883 [Zasmidium cellare]